jgi:hypothetical protein
MVCIQNYLVYGLFLSSDIKTKAKILNVQGGSNITGTSCDLFTHNQSRSYLNHLVLRFESGFCFRLQEDNKNRCLTLAHSKGPN